MVWHAGGRKKGIYIRILQTKKKQKTPEEAMDIGCEDVEEAACPTGTPIKSIEG